MKLKTQSIVHVKNKKHSICIAVAMSFQFWFSLGSQQSPLLVTVKHSSSLIIRFQLGGSSLLPLSHSTNLRFSLGFSLSEALEGNPEWGFWCRYSSTSSLSFAPSQLSLWPFFTFTGTFSITL